jgi:glycosyltransferase involved in cell wall biosynthesis
MKVALVSFLFEPEIGGGAAAAVRALAYGLAEQSVQVVVITTHSRRQIIVEQADGLTIYRFLPRNLYWVGEKDRQPLWRRVLWQLVDVWNPHSFWVVRRILERERPDIVHVHKLRGLSPAVWAAARAAGVGLVVQTCHDYELMSPEGTLTGRAGYWAHEGIWFLRPYQRIRAGFSQEVAAATAPSRYTLETLTRAGFFPQAFKQVVHNSHGLTLEQLDRRREEVMARRHPCGERALRLLYLGRLEIVKGVDLLCAAFERCAVRFPNLHLDIAGWGALEQTLRQRYGRHPQITFHGPVFGEDKEHLLVASDLLVMPSIWHEVAGIVISEAYTYGKPVIASCSGGAPELVEEGRTGILIPPRDIEALTRSLYHVAEDPVNVRQMAPACFEAARRHAVEPVTEGYLAVYEAARGA